MDVAQVQGRVRTDLIQQVREAIDQAPEDTAAIVRGWLQEG
jgi:flagellar biosynthesis/type III secretory pathway M-ring protein FliF/YscJ